MNNNNGMLEYKQKQALKHYLIKKYSKLLEFNKEVRDSWRLTNFIKKKVLFNVFNLTENEINSIPPIFRFRCYITELNESDVNEINEINEAFEIQMEAIKFENDSEIKQILLSSLMEEKSKQLCEIRKSNKSIKIPIMLDLSVYGPNPDIPVYFGDKLYELDETTKINITRSYSLTNPSTITGQRFTQMLNESKILRDSYNNCINKKSVLKDDNFGRVLQKAKNS